jgi:hypothetical protein
MVVAKQFSSRCGGFIHRRCVARFAQRRKVARLAPKAHTERPR